MTNGNYPPGAANDPRAPYNEPDTSHEHEWVPAEDGPILEDGAAIFVENCRWEKVLNAEKGYEGDYVVTESIPCDEQRTTRMEAKRAADVERDLMVAIPPKDEYDEISPLAEEALCAVELAWREDEVNYNEVDPDPQHGHVVAQADEYRVVYRAQ
jgi:hypothetical protein